MGLNQLESVGPAKNCVAFFTIGTHLAPVYVRMAIGALDTGKGKDGIEMAKPAIHILVGTSQWIPGLLMVKIRRRAYRRPTGIRMAVRAIQTQRTMRIEYPALLHLSEN